jgi:hypothetical protein
MRSSSRLYQRVNTLWLAVSALAFAVAFIVMERSPVVVHAPGAAAASIADAGAAAASANASCLPGQRAFLRARLRGALVADLDWKPALADCEGGARPDGRGIRVSLVGPLGDQGQKLRLVFGMSAMPAAEDTRNVAANLTLIVEGAQQLYSTQGDDKCSVDELQQRPLAAENGGGDYEITARGFCIGAASTLDHAAQVWMDRFDFNARIHLDGSDLHAQTTT